MNNHGWDIYKLTDHLFRREAGRMVSILVRIFGTANLEMAEDVVQNTFIEAMRIWKLKGIPDNPSAWLFRVSKNKAIDIIRKNKHSVKFDLTNPEHILLTSGYTMTETMESLWKEELVKDDVLRMMFACCSPGIPPENQVTLILKTLCGFSTAEIAKAFLTKEDTISKRLYRTREFFREHHVSLAIPSLGELKSRTEVVLNSIYLLFNEGYNSTDAEELVRQELIDEAMVLCRQLAENEHTQLPEVYALMGLMCFHAARSESRINPEGEIILLANQDRKKWDTRLINLGNEYMDKAAFGNVVSRFHLEAAIAYEHCVSSSFENTNWQRISYLYDWLYKLSPTAVTGLNRAAAKLQADGTGVAMKALNDIEDRKTLETYYLYYSLLGEIKSRSGLIDEAVHNFGKAAKITRSQFEKKLLGDKIALLGKQDSTL